MHLRSGVAAPVGLLSVTQGMVTRQSLMDAIESLPDRIHVRELASFPKDPGQKE